MATLEPHSIVNVEYFLWLQFHNNESQYLRNPRIRETC